LLDRAELIGRLDALKMSMIALAAFVVISDFPDTGATVEQRIFQAVG